MHENDSDDIEKIISDLYSDVSQEQPSSALDEKILSEARKELQEKSSDTVRNFPAKGGGPFSGRWTVPVSLAAVIILSVTVVVTIEKERPYQLTSPPDELDIAENDNMRDDSLTAKPMLKDIAEKEEVAERKTVTKKSKEPLAVESNKEQEVLALMQRARPERQQLAKKSAQVSGEKPEVRGRQQDTVSADSAADKAPRESIGSAGLGAASGSSASEPEMASAAAPSKKVISMEDKAETPADSPAASEESESEESGSEPGEFATFATMTKPESAKNPDEPRLSTLTERSDASDVDEPVIAEEKQQAISSVEPEIAAASPAKAFIAQSRENAIAESASQSICASLSITDCLDSVECTLESGSADTVYQCRAANNQCELGFSQASDTRETCESKTGCQYKAADCFCPPGVECVCGGGSPAACVPE